MSACRHPYAHQRIIDVAKMDGTIGEERWCTLCGHIFATARANQAVSRANKATPREDTQRLRLRPGPHWAKKCDHESGFCRLEPEA